MPSVWRGYAAFALAACFFGHEFVQRVSTSILVSDLMAEFAVGGAVLGSLSAFYFYAYAGMQIPVGVLMDRFGPRRLMCVAAAVSALGALIFATAQAIEFAYLGRAMIGLGASFSWIGALTVATLWLPTARFAMLTGLLQAGGMAGGVLGQAPLALLVAAFGWRFSLGALALVGASLALAIYLVVPDAAKAEVRQVRPRLTDGLRIAAANLQTWLNTLFGLAMTGTMLAFAGLWAVPWLESAHGYSRATAASLASAMFLGWGIGAPLIGVLADRLARRKAIMVVCGTAMSATLLVLLYVPGLPTALLVGLLFANGAFASSMILSYGAARDHNPPDASGAVYGIVNTGVVGSGALFQPAIGALLDLNWHGTLVEGARIYDVGAYQSAFAVLPAMALLGTFAAAMAAEAKRT
jgi:MFS family permease